MTAPANQLIITALELRLYALSDDFLSQFDTDVIDAQLQAVTDECVSRISPRYTPPLARWGSDLKAAAGRILAYELKSIVGIAPTGADAGDANLLARAQASRDFLDRVGRGEPGAVLQDIVDAGGSSGEGVDAAIVALPFGRPPRGWG